MPQTVTGPPVKRAALRPAPPVNTYRKRLEEARRLGYLRCDVPMGRLSELWLDRCERLRIPYVTLAPRGGLFECHYMMPSEDPYVLGREARSAVESKVAWARSPRARSTVWVTDSQGHIPGLVPERAEAVAFFVAELLNDPAHLRNNERETDQP